MKGFYSILLFTSCFCGSCQPADYNNEFKKMEWLLGTWTGESGGQPFYENWERVSPTEFKNINFSLCDGDTIIGGRSRIEIRNNKIAYTSDSLTWEMKSSDSNHVIFESTRHKEKFTFSKTGRNEWKANLQYPNSTVEYLLTKTGSVSDLLKIKLVPVVGVFDGVITFNNKELHTRINLYSENGRQLATTSTPANLQLNQPFTGVCYNPPFIKLTIPDGTQQLVFNGRIDNDILKGNIAGEIPAVIHLVKLKDVSTATKNYNIEPVIITNGETELAGNLFLPVAGTPCGAVIMISGTGQHAKEEYNGWADLLASKGVAVLAYDKRNVTDFSHLNIRRRSTDIVLPGQLESDILSAIHILKSRKEINPSGIGLFGFSQGAVLAPIVAAGNTDISFIVAVSGNTTTDKEFIVNQALNKLRQRNFKTGDIAVASKIWELLFQYTKDKKDGDKIQQQLDKAYEAGYGQYALPRQLPNDDEIKYLSTWNSFEHDPAMYLSKLNVPSYFVFGQKDLLIPVDRSIEILDSIYKSKKHLLALKLYPDANHYIRTGIDRNNFEFPGFADGYIEEMTKWIVEKSK